MRRRDIYWSLFHSTEKRQIDDLKTDAIEIVFEVLPAANRAQWLIWREGFATWKSLADFPTLLVSLRRAGMMNAPSQPAPAPATKTANETAVQETSAKKETTIQERLSRQSSLDSEIDLDILSETEFGDRASRYQKKWQVRILTDGKPILLTTVDVSNRGFSLKETVPKGLPRYFNVEVIAQDMTIPMICSEVHSSTGLPSTRIRIEVLDDRSLLQAALLQ